MAPKKQVVRNKPTYEGHLLYSDEHLEVFGTGWEHTVYTKAMLIHFEKGLRNLWSNGDGTYKYRISRPSGNNAPKFEQFFREQFKQVSGFEVTQAQKFMTQVRENNGYLRPREPKGPERIKLEQQFHELPKWMEQQVEQASSGSYLTIQSLMEKFKKDFIEACQGPVQEGEDNVQPVQKMPGKEVFRRALHDMNFDYMKRRVYRLEARQSKEVLERLDEFLDWTVENYLLRPSQFQPGKMVHSYKPEIRVGAGDESYMDSSEYRDFSWTSENLRNKNFLKRNKRLALVHTIFSEKNMDPNGEWIVKPAVWCTQWKKKQKDFDHWGKTDAENLGAIYNKAIFELANGAKEESKNILFLDNYSAHKRIRDELRGTPQEIIDWVNDNKEEVDEELKQTVHALQESASQRGGEVERKDLYQILKEKGVPLYQLEALAKSYNGQVEIKYLPPYYSELNPIERLWAEVKRFYRDNTNPKDEWSKRMAEAWDSITPQFIESCFDRSIRWALHKHKERQLAKVVAPVAEPDAPEAEDADDHNFEELLEEAAIGEEEIEEADEQLDLEE